MPIVMASCPILPPAAAAACMAADLAVIAALAAPEGPDHRCRVFFWSGPAVSFGRSGPPTPPTVARLAGAGIDSVVRPTGGAALLHGPGLELSFSAARRRPRGRGTLDLVEEGRRLAEPVVAGLRRLGVRPAFRDCAACGPAGESARLPLCFLQRTPFDILLEGRKIAAFALRRTAGVVFLHGSILVGPVRTEMVEALREAGVGSEAEWAAALAEIGHVEADASRLAREIAASV